MRGEEFADLRFTGVESFYIGFNFLFGLCLGKRDSGLLSIAGREQTRTEKKKGHQFRLHSKNLYILYTPCCPFSQLEIRDIGLLKAARCKNPLKIAGSGSIRKILLLIGGKKSSATRP
jgi:hypothetical protein